MIMKRAAYFFLCATVAFLSSTLAQTAGKRFPAPGIQLPLPIRESLSGDLGKLQAEIRFIRETRKGDNALQVLPDIEVYEKAVR